MSQADKILIFDLETQNHQYCGAVASPRHPENYVVMVGQSIDSPGEFGQITGVRYNSKEEAAKWLSIPDDVWLLVAHNAPYELDWMWHQQRDELLRFLKRGGRVFCTALGHYLLSNQQDKYPALDVIAPMYGGTPKVDGVKLLWEQGVLTADIDPDLLAEYLLGPSGDIENTRRVFYKQVQQLQERGMWEMALDRMEGMLGLTAMMDAGLKIDPEVAEADRAALASEVQELRQSFTLARANFPEDLEFKETSKHHMSAWVYGGPIKYRAKVPWLNEDGTMKMEQLECYKFGENYVQVDAINGDGDAFARCVQTYGDPDRFKAGKNKGQPKVHKVASNIPKMKWGEKVFQAPGLIDTSALPKDFWKSFLEDNTGKLKLVDESPVISVSGEALQALVVQAGVSPESRQIIQNLIRFYATNKDLSTYYLVEEYDDNGVVVKQSGMLQYKTPENVIHHNLNTTSTETTRLSSNRPNFQNLPRGDENEIHTSRVKRMFVSRFGDDGYIVGPDYTALEVVGLACMSQDKALCASLVAGTDMHCMRLAGVLGESYDSVFEKCHTKDHPEHGKYKLLRTLIKPKAFAYQYGATAAGIAYATGCTVDEAQAFIDAEKALFPEVEAWFNESVFPTVNASVVQHREQFDDGRWRVYGVGTWVSPAGTTYQFRQHPKTRWVNGQRVDLMEFKPTQMRNYPIQGESSFWVQVIVGKLIRWLIANDFFGGKVYMINTVHDAVYFDIHKSVMKEVCPQIKAIMESIPQALAKYPGYTFPVPFPVSVEYGKNMQDMEPFNAEEFSE